MFREKNKYNINFNLTHIYLTNKDKKKILFNNNMKNNNEIINNNNYDFISDENWEKLCKKSEILMFNLNKIFNSLKIKKFDEDKINNNNININNINNINSNNNNNNNNNKKDKNDIINDNNNNKNNNNNNNDNDNNNNKNDKNDNNNNYNKNNNENNKLNNNEKKFHKKNNKSFAKETSSIISNFTHRSFKSCIKFENFTQIKKKPKKESTKIALNLNSLFIKQKVKTSKNSKKTMPKVIQKSNNREISLYSYFTTITCSSTDSQIKYKNKINKNNNKILNLI